MSECNEGPPNTFFIFTFFFGKESLLKMAKTEIKSKEAKMKAAMSGGKAKRKVSTRIYIIKKNLFFPSGFLQPSLSQKPLILCAIIIFI